VHKVILSVSMGVNGYVEVGPIWKLDLQGLRFFLARGNTHLRYVRDGQPVAQLPFSHSAFFNLLGDLRVVLILTYCQSLVPSRSFLKEDFGRTHRNPAA
jgi:hypothetical protein